MSNKYECPDSAAKKLAAIINTYINRTFGPFDSNYGRISPADVRRMIRENWSKISPLAHTVHEEECEEQKKLEIRERNELARLKAKYEC